MKSVASKERDHIRMQRPSHPMPVIGRGQQVHVYTGAGWSKGTVQESSRDRCSVHLSRENKTTVCRDARNIKRIND